ncbi:hypothetical protein M0R45_037002 [Rubus argutus]|uniref:SKP1 component POZ domain-containing protein n=1 Tax=Rubus argutus TaxID=59490 RepID=A0AAW1W2W6_RUBAR
MSWKRTKVLRLESKDGKVLEADEYCMRAMSEIINDTFKMMGTNNYFSENENNPLVLLVEKVDSKTLAMVIEWCENHSHQQGKCTTPEELKAWDAEFIKGLDRNLTFHLERAAGILQIKELYKHMMKTSIDQLLTSLKEVVPDLPKITYTYEPRPARTDYNYPIRSYIDRINLETN